MENTKKRIIIILVLGLAISIILLIIGFALGERQINSEPWVLQTYGNNVALIRGEEIIEVYSAIMVDTLPEEDKRMLENGLSFLTKEEAVMAIEDYDG